MIPEQALRIKLTLSQVIGHGMTAFTTIGRAMKAYLDFYWKALEKEIGGEFIAFFNAVTTVNGNPYYGLSKASPVNRVTVFPNLAYACQQLMIRVGD